MGGRKIDSGLIKREMVKEKGGMGEEERFEWKK